MDTFCCSENIAIINTINKCIENPKAFSVKFEIYMCQTIILKGY